jgi:hypothetical protein
MVFQKRLFCFYIAAPSGFQEPCELGMGENRMGGKEFFCAHRTTMFNLLQKQVILLLVYKKYVKGYLWFFNGFVAWGRTTISR